MGNRVRFSKIIFYIFLFLYIIFSVTPLVWLFAQSLKEESEFLLNVWSFPKKIVFENYAKAWIESKFFLYFFNSALYTAVSTFVIVFFSVLAGFAFSKLKFFAKDVFYYLIIVNLLIPTAMIILPIFFLVRDLGIRNTLPALVFPYFTGSVPLCVVLARNYFNGIPNELMEAGKIDGCSIIKLFFKIMLPLTGPLVATISIITAMGVWNEYLWALVSISEKTKYTVSIGLANLNATKSFHSNTVVFAAIAINCIVIIAIYAIFQKQFIKSIISGSIKG